MVLITGTGEDELKAAQAAASGGPSWDANENAWFDGGASGLYSYDDGASWEPKRYNIPPPVSTAGALASLAQSTGNYSLNTPALSGFSQQYGAERIEDGLGHWWDSSIQAWRNNDGSVYSPLQSAPAPVSTAGALASLGESVPVDTSRAGFLDYDLGIDTNPPELRDPWNVGKDESEVWGSFRTGGPPTASPQATPSVAAGAAPTWNAQYGMWEDASGSLWDENSGVWWDPQGQKVYRDKVGWQTVDEFNDYNNVLREFGEFSNNPLAAQPGRAGFLDYDLGIEQNPPILRDPWSAAAVPQDKGLFDQAIDIGGDVINTLGRSQPGGYLWEKLTGWDTGETYDQYNENIGNPLAETGAQLTPFIAAGSTPGGMAILDPVSKLFGMDASESGRAGVQELGSALAESGGNPLRFGEIQNENFAERPWWQQTGAAALYDPTNAIPLNLGAKAVLATDFADDALRAAGQAPDILRAAHAGEEGVLRMGKAAADNAAASVVKAAPTPAAPLATLDEAPLGFGGADSVLRLKAETIPEAGPISQAIGSLPGGKKVMGAFDPSKDMSRQVYTASLGQQAANADVATRLASTRGPIVEEITDAFRVPPRYIGPADNPLKGTFLDIAENPRDYVLNPRQVDVLAKLEQRGVDGVQLARSQYGVDIGLKKPATGGVYVPRVNANEDLVKQGVRTEQSLKAPKIAKERVWETARERAISDPAFKPETDIHKLLTIHDNAIAKAAGDSTFMRGVGGQTRMEVIEEIRPGLKAARDKAAARVASIRGQLDTALKRENRYAGDIRESLGQQRRLDDYMAPLDARVAELEMGGEFGPELSYLSGEIRQLKRQAAAAAREISGTPKVPGVGAKLSANDVKIQRLMHEIDGAKDDLTRLAGQYKNINIPDRAGMVMSPHTYKYHPADVANDIAKLKQESLGPLDKVFEVAETSRQTALGADISPVTIQGGLSLWRDPISTISGVAKMAKDIVTGNGAGLARLGREEPEMVARFVKAKGRALGSHMDEFGTDKSLMARIPKVGGKFTKANDALFDGIARIEYETWKNTTAVMRKLNPNVSDDVIDFGVANSMSKSVPSMNPAERGISAARNKAERMIATSISFATAPPALMKDAASAVVKLGVGKRPTIREQVGLIHLLSIGATTTAASTLSAAVYAQQNGLDVEAEIKKALNPANKEFMAIKLPNGMRVPIGGPFRSFIKAMAPVDRDGNLKQPDIYDWAKNRVAPLPGAGIDLLQNADFEGTQILKGSPLERTGRGLEYILEQAFLPITAGQVPQGIRQGKGREEIMQDVLSQASGTNAQPQSPYDQRDERLANDSSFEQYRIPGTTGQLTWDKLGTAGQAEYNRRYGAVEPVSDEAKASADLTVRLTEQQSASDARRDAGELTPEQWRNDYTARKEDRFSRNDQIWAGTDFKPGNDKVLNAYYNAIDGAERTDGTVDWDKVDAYVAGLSEGDRAWVAANTGLVKLSTPATEAFDKEYRTIKDSGWFKREDAVWKPIARDLGLPYEHYDDWYKAQREALFRDLGATTEDQKLTYSAEVDKFINKDQVAKYMANEGSAWREEFAITNPEAAYLAWKYGYWNPPAAVREALRDWQGARK